MGRKRPERETVEQLLKENKRRKSYDIAEAAGLIGKIGYDRAIDYVRSVRKAMKKTGDLPQEENRYAPDSERLEDITKLFELRQGRMSERAARTMLLLNCYLRLRSADDQENFFAIDDTYDKNRELENPLELETAIAICELALDKYMASIDEEKNAAAVKRGFPGAGLNYTSETLIEKLEITEEELAQLTSIRRG